jgi:hypothetical protein
MDCPVFCGIGNVGIIESAIKAERRLEDHIPLRIVAHHAQLAALQAGAALKHYPIVWEGEKALDPTTISFTSLQEIHGRELNVLTGALAAKLVLKILSGASFSTNVPGPIGLPGGYPVTIRGQELRFDLPDSMTLEEATLRNSEAGFQEGVRVLHDGTIEFSDAATLALREVRPRIPQRIASSEILELSKLIEGIRNTA